MALLTSELYRLKAELGYNVLQTGAEPYVGVYAFFDVVVQPYLESGATTTCSTVVSDATPGALVSLTLASATGFAAQSRIVIDVDAQQEIVTVESLSGSVIGVRLRKAHSGTYPVTVEGGESLVREYLSELSRLRNELKQLSGSGAIKKVDEVEFYPVSKSGTQFNAICEQIEYWRNQLAALLGLTRNPVHRVAGGSVAVY